MKPSIKDAEQEEEKRDALDHHASSGFCRRQRAQQNGQCRWQADEHQGALLQFSEDEQAVENGCQGHRDTDPAEGGELSPWWRGQGWRFDFRRLFEHVSKLSEYNENNKSNLSKWDGGFLG